MSKVLIVSYTFPPRSGVGGRRWAKFAKYLHRAGYDIHVITADNSRLSQNSPWIKDVEELYHAGRVSKIPSGYYQILGKNPGSLYEKLLYRYAAFRSRQKYPGNFYDTGCGWKKYLLPEVEKFIAQGYKNIIVTLAPFKPGFFLTEIKHKYPDINFIVDIRDPWTGNKTAYGFYHLSKERQNFEIEAEKLTFTTADHLITVNEEMSKMYREKYRLSTVKTIINGFDPDDFKAVPSSPDRYSGKIQLVLGGTLYNHTEHHIQSLTAALEKLKKHHPDFYALFEFHFYGDAPLYFKKYAEKEIKLKHHSFVKLNVLYEKLAASTGGMLFLTDDLNYTFSTKFCEYLALRKPIFVFTKEGKTGRFVEANKIGYMITPENSYSQLLRIASDFLEHRLPVPDESVINRFNIQSLVKEYEKLLL